MADQKSLFETISHDGNHSVRPARLARQSDKATSREAATRVDLKGKRKLFYETLKAMGNIPRTANEVAEKAIAFDGVMSVQDVLKARETLRKRALDCVKSGWVRECSPRECRVNGNNATTYEVISG